MEGSEGLPKELEGLSEGSEGLPEGSEGLPEGSGGLPEGSEGLSGKPKGLLEGLVDLSDGLEGLPGETYGQMYVQAAIWMFRIYPRSTGYRTLSRPLPKKAHIFALRTLRRVFRKRKKKVFSIAFACVNLPHRRPH